MTRAPPTAHTHTLTRAVNALAHPNTRTDVIRMNFRLFPEPALSDIVCGNGVSAYALNGGVRRGMPNDDKLTDSVLWLNRAERNAHTRHTRSLQMLAAAAAMCATMTARDCSLLGSSSTTTIRHIPS